MNKATSFIALALVAISFTAILRSADNSQKRLSELAQAQEKLIAQHAKTVAELMVCQRSCMRPRRRRPRKQTIAYARHDTEWKETNKKFFRYCLDHKKFTKFTAVNPALLMLVCNYSTMSGQKYNHIHDFRSFHHGGAAIDFYFGSYIGMDQCRRAREFEFFAKDFSKFLIELKLGNRMGLGFYPYNRWTPSFHLDARGNGVFWLRTPTGSYLYFSTIEEAIEKVITATEEICSARLH